jgi:tRNA-splicing ligase RtcB
MTLATERWPAVRRDAVTVEIPQTARAGMRVPAVVFADDELWAQIASDRTIDQLLNVATLPGIIRCAYAMPDAHEGYGFPVGGVAAFRASDGIVSPGGVGYDINCGVRLLASTLTESAVRPQLEHVVHELSRSIPSGTGRGSRELLLDRDQLDSVLALGVPGLLDRGMVEPDDLSAIEQGGAFAAADPSAVSPRAKDRGSGQLGTIGAGNHFVELQRVDSLYDLAAARAFGLEPGQVTVLIHTGSRGLGHQVCTDHVRAMDAAMRRFDIVLPDRELACAPYASSEGRSYFAAMCAAANFAFANRQAIAHAARRVFRRAFGEAGSLRLVYDVAHNMAKLETVDGEPALVHRKGATRAFGAAHPDTPSRYRGVGQPVLIPGSMGTASYVLAGTDEGLGIAFGSSCHGAGRRMSRHAATRLHSGAEVRRELEARGIVVRCPRSGELAEEAPDAYKDVERVVDVVERAGLARKVARLVPLGVIKG